jgi:acyl-CoA thioesterase FadM
LVRFYAENGARLDHVLRTRRFLAPIRHAEADYFSPLRFADRVEVALVRAHLEPTEVTLGFRIAREDDVCAVAQSVHTFLDSETHQRMPIPDSLRSAWSALAG